MLSPGLSFALTAKLGNAPAMRSWRTRDARAPRLSTERRSSSGGAVAGGSVVVMATRITTPRIIASPARRTMLGRLFHCLQTRQFYDEAAAFGPRLAAAA